MHVLYTCVVSNMGKVQKTDFEKLNNLEDHLFHLKENLTHVKNDGSYYKIISATLRVLICKTNSNKPLLLKLTNKADFKLLVDSRGKWDESESEIELKDYIERDYYTINIPISLKNLILSVAQQDGTGHEDNSVDWTTRMTQITRTTDLEGNNFNLATKFINDVAYLTINLGIIFLEAQGYIWKRKKYWTEHRYIQNNQNANR